MVFWFALVAALISATLPPFRYFFLLTPFLVVIALLADGAGKLPEEMWVYVAFLLGGLIFLPLAGKEGMRDLFLAFAGISVGFLASVPKIRLWTIALLTFGLAPVPAEAHPHVWVFADDMYERLALYIDGEWIDGGGRRDQPVERLAPQRVLEVEHDRALVAVGHVPAEVDRMLRNRVGLAELALRVALAGRFDLDDLGAIVAHHRRGHGPGDEAGQIEDPQALQRQLSAH